MKIFISPYNGSNYIHRGIRAKNFYAACDKAPVLVTGSRRVVICNRDVNKCYYSFTARIATVR